MRQSLYDLRIGFLAVFLKIEIRCGHRSTSVLKGFVHILPNSTFSTSAIWLISFVANPLNRNLYNLVDLLSLSYINNNEA